MKLISFQAIYVLWLREMKRTWRAKSRVIGSLIMPLFFLIFLGTGFRRATMPGIPQGVNYMQFLIPGVLGMTLLFSSIFGGLQVLWDKEFGFLKEIMVAPVSRISIVLGRIAASSSSALLQGFLILFLSMFVGFRFQTLSGLLIALAFMILIACTFIGLGLAFASRMKDMQGFQIIMNFVIFPIFFLSGALFPIQGLPKVIKYITYFDPLTYGVDGLRNALVGTSNFSLQFDFIVLTVICIIIVTIGSWLFETSEVGQ